jgi:hypothetical protein
MALRAERFEAEMIIEERVARLESDVHHMRSDIAEMKVDIRRIDSKVDAVKDSVAALEVRMLGGFAAVDGKFAELEKKMLAGFAELDKKMLTGFAELNGKTLTIIGEVKVGRVWDRVWMLMIAAALLGIIARIFKWI